MTMSDNGIFFYGRRILFIGAHPDDIELGCGALIAQIVDKTDNEYFIIHIKQSRKGKETISSTS